MPCDVELGILLGHRNATIRETGLKEKEGLTIVGIGFPESEANKPKERQIEEFCYQVL